MSKSQKQIPMLFKVSLKHHSPQQIYDYVMNHIGDLGMKIKKRQAIIGFQSSQYASKLVTEHKIVKLHGKKLEFIPIKHESEIKSQGQQINGFEISAAQPKISFPQIKCKTSFQTRVNERRFSMLKKVHQLFQSIVEVGHQRIQQLKLQYKEIGLYQRQVLSLEKVIDKKLQGFQSRYEADILKLHKFIHDFSLKPNTIQLEPKFQIQQSWQFPRIPDNHMSFSVQRFYKNHQSFQCKRMCAINGNEFVVSMANPKKAKGYLKIYNLQQSDPKQTVTINPGAYGLCRVNNFLFVGSYDNTIKYINLQDQERQVQPSRSLNDRPNTSFFQIKIIKHSLEKPQILTLNTDGIMRKFELSFDQVASGIFSANFDLKMDLYVSQNCQTCEVISPNIILYGGVKRIRKHQLNKKLQNDIPIADTALKIKKFNHNIYAVASMKVVEMVDMRALKVVQAFPQMVSNQIKTIETIGDHSIMYGGQGEIGLLDDRKHQTIPWKSDKHHEGKVYDILKLKNRIVSCDYAGGIYSWKLSEEASKAEGNSFGTPISIQFQ